MSVRTATAGLLRFELARELETIEARQFDGGDHNVGRNLAAKCKRLGAIAGLAYDVHICLRLEQEAQAGAYNLLVIYQNDSDHHIKFDLEPCFL